MAIAAAWLLPGAALAAANVAETSERLSPGFVTASLLVVSPGNSLYSCAGHACFRMECPKHNLDFCFSYESESVSHRVAAFLAGKLKMGMFSMPTAKFLSIYEEEGRGVRQYELNLSPAAKQRLWKVLDDAVAEGSELKYDFIRHGCAQSALLYLRKAANPEVVTYGKFAPKYDKTLRELFVDALDQSPWNLVCLQTLVGTDVDTDLPKINRVIIPADLVEFLRGAKIGGKAVIAGEAKSLVPMTRELKRPAFTPVMAAGLVVLLALVGWVREVRWLNWLFLAIQAGLGLLLSYLIFVSSLPATTWNWLIIPFNPLPPVFWKWRRAWSVGFALVIVGWIAAMAFAPHRGTDPALMVLAGAHAVFYLSPFVRRHVKAIAKS